MEKGNHPSLADRKLNTLDNRKRKPKVFWGNGGHWKKKEDAGKKEARVATTKTGGRRGAFERWVS